jgi:adenylosuccinate synthase
MKQAYIIAGLAFGDCGKGKMTDFLTRHYHADLVVRYNGGPQAAHTVVLPNGTEHTFSQFGSGTLAGAATHLSKYMLVEPMALQREADVLRSKGIADPFDRLTIDPNCVIITPWHRLMNRLREVLDRHGSVGLGVGEARMDELDGFKLVAGQLKDLSETIAMLRTHRCIKLAQAAELLRATPKILGKNYADQMEQVDPGMVANDLCSIFKEVELLSTGQACQDSATVVFEGAQGVLLDETVGYQPPHVSWTNCTFQNADKLLEDSGWKWEVKRIGVLRTYFTRHGMGPFPTEDTSFNFPEKHNGTHPWMGSFRQGRFDYNLAKYAIEKVGKIDCIALTHCDYADLITGSLYGVPIKYRSIGPTYQDTEVCSTPQTAKLTIA